MSNFAVFLKKERLYILLLVFVAIFTAMVAFTPSDNIKPSGSVAAKAAPAYTGDKASSDHEAVEKILSENKNLAFIFALISLLTIALFLLGLVIDTIFLWARSSGEKLIISTYEPRKANWGLWDVSKVIILYFFFSYILLTIEVLIMSFLPVMKDMNFRMMLNSSIMDVLSVIFILYFAGARHKDSFASLGLSLKNFFRNVYYGIAAYVALVPVLIGIVAVLALILSLTKYLPQKQPIVDLFLKEKDVSFLLYASLFAAIAGPIIEEIFFRGFLYNAIKKYIGILWATLITAAMFAILHAHLVGFLPILALGILLAYMYEKTGTLVSSITIHIVHNAGMVLLALLVKQLGVY